MNKKILVIVAILFFTKPTQAQCCIIDDPECWGICLGYLAHSGISVSYGLQGYTADGFNRYIDVYNAKRVSTLTKQMGKFGQGQFVNVTLYLVDLPLEVVRFGLKGSYQYMWENQQSQAGTIGTRDYNLAISTIGIGFDARMKFIEFIELKMIDMQLLFSSATFTNELTSASLGNTSEKLTSAESYYGLMIGAGALFYPMGEIFSLEGNVGYVLMEINRMKFSNGSFLQRDENTAIVMDDFINRGGLYASVGMKVALGFENMFK